MHDAGIRAPFVLALEPNRVQASRLSSVVRGLHADLALVNSIDRMLHALDDRLPDLILIPALLSRKDEASLTDRLRELGTAASHVQTLTIPILAGAAPPRSRGVLKSLRRGKSRAAVPDGCDPGIFGGQISEYLARAAEARLATQPAARHLVQTRPDPEGPLSASQSDTPESTIEPSPVPLEVLDEPIPREPAAVTVAREPERFEEPFISVERVPVTMDEQWGTLAEQPGSVAHPYRSVALADDVIEITDEPAEFEKALAAFNEFPMAFEQQLDAFPELPQPVAPQDDCFALPDQDVAFPEDPAGFDEALVTLDEVTANDQLVSFAEEPVAAACSEPPLALAEPLSFEMPPIVVEESWPEPPQIAEPEQETISLTSVVAPAPEEAPHIDVVIAPDPEPADLGAWWMAASVEDRAVPSLPEADTGDQDAWMLMPTPAMMQVKEEGISEEPEAATVSPLTPLFDLRGGVIDGESALTRRRSRQFAKAPRHVPTTPIEVVFLPPDIITVHEDACATMVIPRPAGRPAAKPVAPVATRARTTDPTRQTPDTTRRRGDTTRRKKTTPPIQDEWGLFDPTKCGFSALLEKLDEITTPEQSEQSDADVDVRIVTY